MKYKLLLGLSTSALLLSLLAVGFTFCRTTPIEIDWLGILVGILALLTTILLGWQIVSYMGFKDEIKKEIEQEKSFFTQATDAIRKEYQEKIEQAQNVIYKKNEYYIQGVIDYIEAFPIINKDSAVDDNYGSVYKTIVSAISNFCKYGSGAEENIERCLLGMERILNSFCYLLRSESSDTPFNDYIENNFKALDLSQDVNFLHLKISIVNSELNNISQEYIDRFLAYEIDREKIMEKHRARGIAFKVRLALENKSTKNKE